ncbi:PREDICTED: titin isoform X13 [Nelumbo nucifera]|uniref:Titin isoform X13 n=1 Tax=Nelumbo nucifera TaxID=4432 RepID=A0A1U8Q0U4_NELNU|nr:PREDICTED: titin isoform X13 [Nelumbo nucifera]
MTTEAELSESSSAMKIEGETKELKSGHLETTVHESSLGKLQKVEGGLVTLSEIVGNSTTMEDSEAAPNDKNELMSPSIEGNFGLPEGESFLVSPSLPKVASKETCRASDIGETDEELIGKEGLENGIQLQKDQSVAEEDKHDIPELEKNLESVDPTGKTGCPEIERRRENVDNSSITHLLIKENAESSHEVPNLDSGKQVCQENVAPQEKHIEAQRKSMKETISEQEEIADRMLAVGLNLQTSGLEVQEPEKSGALHIEEKLEVKDTSDNMEVEMAKQGTSGIGLHKIETECKIIEKRIEVDGSTTKQSTIFVRNETVDYYGQEYEDNSLAKSHRDMNGADQNYKTDDAETIEHAVINGEVPEQPKKVGPDGTEQQVINEEGTFKDLLMEFTREETVTESSTEDKKEPSEEVEVAFVKQVNEGPGTTSGGKNTKEAIMEENNTVKDHSAALVKGGKMSGELGMDSLGKHYEEQIAEEDSTVEDTSKVSTEEAVRESSWEDEMEVKDYGLEPTEQNFEATGCIKETEMMTSKNEGNPNNKPNTSCVTEMETLKKEKNSNHVGSEEPLKEELQNAENPEEKLEGACNLAPSEKILVTDEMNSTSSESPRVNYVKIKETSNIGENVCEEICGAELNKGEGEQNRIKCEIPVGATDTVSGLEDLGTKTTSEEEITYGKAPIDDKVEENDHGPSTLASQEQELKSIKSKDTEDEISTIIEAQGENLETPLNASMEEAKMSEDIREMQSENVGKESPKEELQEDDENYIIELKDETTIERERTTECTKTTENIKPEILKNEEILEANSQDKLDDEEPFVELSTDHQKPGVCANIGKDVLNMEQEKATIKELDESIHEEGKEGDEVDNVSATLEQNPGNIDPIEKLEGASKSVTKDQRHVTVLETKETKIQEDNMTDKDLNTTAPIEDQAFTQSFQEDEKESMNLEDKRPKLETEDHNEKTKNAKETIKNILSNKDEEVSQGEHRTDACESIEKHIKEEEDATKEINSRSHGNEIVEASSNVMDFDLALTKLIIKESDAVTDDSIDAMTLNGKVLNKNLESSPLIEPSKEETGETESSEKQMNIPFLVSEVSEDIIREGFEQPKIVDASEESKKQVIDEEGIAITLSMESTKEEAVEEISQEAKETIGEAHEELATSEGETTKKMIVELSSAVEDHSIVTSKESSQEDEKHGILWTDSEGEVKEKQITENDSITENSSEVPIEEDTAKESFQEEEKEAKKPENVQEIELVSTEHNIEITSHTEEIEMMTTSINEEEILQKQKREYLESKEKLVLCGEKIKVDLEKEENTSKQLNTETIAAVTEGSRLQEAEQGYIQGASDSDSEDKNRITIETKSSSLQSLHVEHVNLEKKANLNVNAGKEILEASEKLETDECEQRIKYEMQVRASDTVPSFEIQVIEITIQTEKIAAKFPLDDKWEERLHESSTSSTKGKEFKSIETSKDIKDEDPIENETQDKNPENSLFSSTMEEMSTRKEELKMLEEVHQMQSEGIKTTSEKEINYGKAPLDEKIEENVQESSALASQEWEFKSIERSGDTKDENPTINEAQSKNVETPFNESTIETKVSEVILEIHSEDIGKESSNEELQEDTGEKDVQVKKMSPNEEFKKTKCTEPTKNIKPEAMKHEEILEAISEDKLYGQNPFVKLPEDLEKPGVCSNTEKDVQDLEQEKETIKKLDEIIEEDGKEGDQVENFMAILEQNPGDVDSGEMLKGASNPVTKDQSYIMIPDTKDTNTQENHMAAKDHNTASVEEQMVTQSFQEDEKRSRNSEDKGAKMDIEDHTEKTENTNEAIRNIPSNEDEEVTQEEDRADASKNTEKPIIDEENTAMELNTISLGDQTVEVSSNVRDCDLASNKLITKESHGTADDSMQTMDEEELNKNPESSVMEFPQEETIEKESSEKHMNVSSLVPEESEEKIIEECEEHKMVDVDPSEETRQQVMDEEGIVITLSMESMDEAAKEISQEVKKETIGEAHQEFATSEGEATKKMVVEESSAVKDHSTLPVKESHQKDEKYGVLQTVSAGEDTEEIIQNDGTVEDSSKVAPGEETAKESFQEDEIEVERHEKAKGFEKVSTKTNTGATSYREKIEMMEPSKNEEEILHKQKKEDLDSNEKIVVSEEHIKEDLEKEENKDKILDIATMTVVTEGAKLQEDEHKMLGVLDSSFKGKNLAAIETNSTSLQSLCVEHMNLENTINLSVHTDKGILETTEKVNTDEDEQKMKMGTFDTVPGFEEQIIETTTHTEITRSRDQLENKMEEKLHGYYTLLSTEKELKSNGTGKDEKDDAPVETKMQDKKKMQSSTLASQEVQMQSEISKTEVTSGKIPLDDKIEENVHESSTLASQEQELNPIERSDDIKDETPKINKAQDENLENPYSGNMTESKMSEDILEMKSEDVRKENLSEEKNHGDVDSGEKLEQASKTVAQNLSHVTIPETKLTKIQEDIIVDKDHDTAPVEDEMVTQSFQGDERESMNLEEKGFTLETDHTKKTDNTDETIQNILSNEDEEVTQGEGRAVASENIEKQNMEDNNSTKEVNITSCGDKKVEVTDTMTNCDLVSTELIIKEPDAAADDDTDTMTLKEFEQPKIVDASQENKKQVIDEEGALITLSIESTGEEAVKETSQEAKPESIEEAHEEHASSEEKVKEIKEGKTAPGGQVNEGFVTTSNGENTKEGVVEGNSNIKDHFAAPVKMICQGDKVEAPSDMHMSEELDTNSAGMQFEKQIAEEEGSMEAGKLNIRVKEELELAQQNIEETGCRVETEEASSQEVEPEEGNLGVVYSLASEENIPEIAEMNSTSMGSLEVKYVEVRDMSNLGKNVMEILGAGQLDEGAGGQNIKKCETVMEATNTQPGFQDKGIETTKETEIHFGKPQLEDKTDENVQEIPTLAPEQQELKPIERSEKRKDETPKINKAQDENLESPFNANMIGPNMSEDILEMQSENTRNKSSNEENTPGDVDSGEKIEQVPESISEDASHVKVPETKQTKIQEDNLIARDHNTAFIEDQIVPQSFQGEEKENMNLEDKGPILETEDMTKIPENANETNKKILSDEDEEVIQGEDMADASENIEKHITDKESAANELDFISLGVGTVEARDGDFVSTMLLIKESDAAADESTDTVTLKDKEELNKNPESPLTEQSKEETRDKESSEKHKSVSPLMHEFEEKTKEESEQLKIVDASEEFKKQVEDEEDTIITLSEQSTREAEVKEISQESKVEIIGEAYEELANSEETIKERFPEDNMAPNRKVYEGLATTSNDENTEEGTVDGNSTSEDQFVATVKEICQGDKVQTSSFMQISRDLGKDSAEKDSKEKVAKEDDNVEDISTITIEEEAFKERSKQDRMEAVKHSLEVIKNMEAMQQIGATWCKEETEEATSQKVELEEDKLEVTCNLASEENIPETYEMNSSSLGSTQDKNVKVKESFNIEENVGEEIQGAEQLDEGENGQNITKSEKPVGATNTETELDDKNNVKTSETKINSCKFPLDEKTNENVQESPKMVSQEQKFKPIERNEETGDQTPEINKAQDENLETPDSANTREPKMSDDILGMKLEDMEKQSTNEEQNPRESDSGKKVQQASEPMGEDLSCSMVPKTKETTIQEDIVVAKDHDTVSIEDQMATHSFQGDEKEIMSLNEKGPTLETEDHIKKKQNVTETVKNIFSNENEEVIEREDRANASWNIEKHIMDEENTANKLDSISPGDEAVDINSNDVRDCDLVSTKLVVKESDAASEDSTEAMSLKDEEEVDKNPKETVYISSNVNIATQVRDSDLVSTKIVVKSDAAADDSTDTMSLKDEEKVNKNHESSPLTEQSKEETREKESSKKQMSLSSLVPKESEAKNKEEFEQLKIVDASEQTEKQVVDEEGTIISLPEESIGEAAVEEILQESKLEGIGEALEEPASSEETAKESFTEDKLAPDGKVNEGLPAINNVENTKERIVEGNSNIKDQSTAPDKEINQGDKVQASTIMQVSGDLDKDSAEKNFEKQITKEDGTVENTSIISTEEEALKEKSKQGRREEGKHSVEVKENELEPAQQNIEVTGCREETKEATPQEVEPEEEELNVAYKLASQENIPETAEMNPSSSESPEDKYVKAMNISYLDETMGEDIQGAEQLDEGEDGQNITKSETLMGATNTASKLNDKSNEKINETENTSGKSPLDDKINEIVQESSLMASQEQDLKPIEGNNETKDETPEINKAQDDNLETPDNATTRESKMSEDILGMQSEDMGKESTNEEQNPREVDSGNKLQQASKPMDEDQSCATFLETTIQEDIVDAKDHNNTASIEDQMATYSFQGDEEESMSLEEKEPTLEIESHTDKTKNATETIKGILLNEDEEVTQGEDRGDASENIEKYIMDTENTAKQLDSISLGDETFDVRDCNLVSTKLIVKESDAISDDRTDTMSFKDEEELNKNPKSYPLTEQSKEETREKESSEKPMSVSSLMPKESEEKTKEECEELKIVVASQETEKQMLDEEGTIITLSKESSAEDAVQEISQEAKTENIGEAHEEPANSEGKATKKMIVKESSAVKDHSTVTVKESSQEVDKHVVLSTDSSGEKTEKHIIDNEVTNDTSEVPTEEETDKKGFHEYEEEAKKPENVQEFELEATEQNFEATSDTEQTEIIATSMNEEELQKQNREDLERSKKLVMCEEQIEEDLGKEENKNKKIDMATITMVKEGSNLQEAEQGNMYGASDSDSEDKNRTTIETKSTSPENQHVGHVNLEKTTNLSLNIDKEILAAEENLDTDEGEQRIKCETQEGASDMVPLFENQVIEMTAQTENTASKVLSDDTLEEKFHESSVSEMKEKALKSMKTSQGINDEVPIENEAQDMNLETTLFCNTTEDMYTQKEEPKKLEEFIQKKTQDIEKDSSKEGLQEDGGIKLNRPTELDSEECISEFKNDAIQEMERTNECTEPSAYRQPEIQKDEESLVESLEKDKSDGGQPLDEAPEDLEKTDLTANIEKDIIHLEKEDDHVKNVEESFENIPGEGDLEHIIMSRTGNDGDEIKEASDSAKNESNLEEQNFGDDDPCEKIEGAYESLPGDQGNQIFPRNGEDCEVKVHNTVCFKDQVVNQNFQADEKVTMILEETGANLEAEDRTKKTEDAKETMMDGILNDSDKMPEGNDNADASESTEKQTSLGDGVLHEITKENDEKTEAINLKDEEVPINKPEASPITELLEEKITQKQSTEKFADGSLLVSGVYEGTIKEEILEGAEKSNEKLDDASVMTITEETSLEKSESEAERTVEASGVGSQEKISETVEKNETSLQHGEIKSVKLDENSNPVQPVLTIEAMDAEKEDVIVENLVADEVEETNRFSDRVSESNDQGVEVIAEPQSTTETSPQCEIRRVESNENPNPVPWLQSKEANSVKSDENSNPLPPLHHEEAKILENDQKSNLVTPLSTIEGKDDKKEYLLVENMGEDKVKEEISKSSDTVSQSKDQGFETITESEITVDQTPLADESEAKLQDPYAFVLEPEVAMATSIEKIKDKMFKEYETMEEKSSDFPFIMETSKETSFQKKEIRDPEVVLTVGIEGTENQSLIEKMCLQREEPRKLAQAYKKGLEDIMESPNTESEEKVVQKLDKSLKIDIEKQFFETKDAHSLLEREKITVVNEPSECSEHQTPKDEETLESNSQKEESERQKLENTFSEVFEGPETGGVRADTERGILEKDGCNENFEEHSEEERKNQNLDAIDPHEKINTAELEITNENLNLEKLEKISQSVPKIQIDQILANTEKNKNKEDGVHVIDQSTVLVEESQHLEKAEQDQCEEENEVNDIARGEEEVSEMIEDHTPSEKVAEWIPEEKGVLEDQHPSCVTKEVAKEDNQEGKEEVKKVEEDATALEHEDQIKELEGVEDHKEKINEVRLTCENSKEEASKELEDVNASENTRKVIAKEKRAVLDSYLVPLGEKICKEMHDEKEEEHVLKVAIKLDHKDQTYNVEIEDELRKKLDEANESAKCETLNEEVCYEINNAKANEKIEKKIKVEEQALKETSIAFSENETIRSQQEDEKEGKKIQDATKLASGDKNDEERGKKDMTGYSIANEEVKSSHFILVEQRLETTGSINQTGTVAMEDKQEVQVKVGNMPEELSGVVSKISVHERMKKKEDHSESRIEDTSSQKDLTEAENLKSTFSHRESSPSGITEYLHKKDMEVLTSDPSNPSLTKASQEKAPENRGKMARDEEVIRQSVFVKQAEVELSIPRDVKEENINDKAPIEEILKKEGKEKSEDGKIHETICTDQNGETKVQEREDQFVVLSTEQATVGRCIRDDTEELDAASNFVLKLKENSHVKTDLVSEAQIQTNEETESTNIEDAGSRNQNLDLSSDIQHLAKEIPTIDGTLNVPEVIEISQNIEILEEASGGISQERILRKEASVKGTGTKIPTEDRNITSVPQHTIEKTLQEAEVTYQRPGEISGTEPEEKAVEYGTKNGVVDEAGETIEEVKPSDTDKVSLSDLLRRPTKETLQMVAQDTKPPGNDDQLENKEEQTMQVEEEKTDEEEKDDEEEEDEHRKADSSSDAPLLVEASRDVDAKRTHKKSHNILSGVGSKVKHSIAKVKKAITGKSSQPKPALPK